MLDAPHSWLPAVHTTEALDELARSVCARRNL